MNKEDFFRIEIIGKGKTIKDTPVSEGFSFEIPEPFENSEFFDENGFPNKTGSLVVTKFLIEALVANIYTVDKAGHYDKRQHIPDAIELLQELLNSKWSVDAGFNNPNDPDQPKTE